MKIYVNGDSHTDGDGIGDFETFPTEYPGHNVGLANVNTDWVDKRWKFLNSSMDIYNMSKANNRKYVWPTILGGLLNATVVNKAVGGSCMLGIATRTIADLEMMRSRADLPDYVFIGLTNAERLSHYQKDVEDLDKSFNWTRSVIPQFYKRGKNYQHDIKYTALFEATWSTLNDEEFLIMYLKECLQIKNYVKRRIGKDPIFLNTTYMFKNYAETVRISNNQWLRMLWFDLLEFDKINTSWFNAGDFLGISTACGHLLPETHSNYAKDLARQYFGWGKDPKDRDAE